MLTKSDLKEIDNLVSKRLQGVAKKDDLKGFATKDDLKSFATKDDLKKELKPIKSDLAKVRKDVDVMLSMFDREYVELRKRVDRIEEHLNLDPITP